MLTVNYIKVENVMGNEYSRLQISVHWLVPLLVIVVYCAMEFRDFFPRSDRLPINTTHVSCDISILVLMVVRLLLRLRCPTPPIISKPKPMMTGLTRLGHLVIYLLSIMLLMVDLVMIYNRGNPWFAFGLTMPYALEISFERIDNSKSWHETLANLGYFVIGLHAAAVLAHHYFWRDNTPLRMMSRKCS